MVASPQMEFFDFFLELRERKNVSASVALIASDDSFQS